MKKILIAFSVLFCSSAHSASYIGNAGNAWLGIGDSNRYSQYLGILAGLPTNRFEPAMNALAFNNSGFQVAHFLRHIGEGLGFASSALTVSPECDWDDGHCTAQRQSAVAYARVFGGPASFKSDKNAEFDANYFGFLVGAEFYMAENFAVGARVIYSRDDMTAPNVSGNSSAQSIVAYAKYAGKGWFANAGALIGGMKFDDDKNVGTYNIGSYHDNDSYSAIAVVGLDQSIGKISLQPFAGVRYALMNAKKYTDSAEQIFGKWSYEAVTALGGINLARTFKAGNFDLTPEVTLGVSYNVRPNMDDYINVTLVDGSSYGIPTDVPSGFAENGSVRLGMSNGAFGASAGYRFDTRSHYTAHTIFGNVSVTF